MSHTSGGQYTYFYFLNVWGDKTRKVERSSDPFICILCGMYSMVQWEKSVTVPLNSFIILSRNVFFCHCTVNRDGSCYRPRTFFCTLIFGCSVICFRVELSVIFLCFSVPGTICQLAHTTEDRSAAVWPPWDRENLTSWSYCTGKWNELY